MKIIHVRGVCIGEGMPKVIAPIVGHTREIILQEAAAIALSGADIAEWRIDPFESGSDAASVSALAQELRPILGNMPLLCTFRTEKEGGQTAIAPEAYARLLTELCRCAAIDMIDVEAFTGESLVRDVIRTAHERSIVVIASNHDFHATPAETEIVRRLTYMGKLGADIAKIAVMPSDRDDVQTLLSATSHAVRMLDCPLITMAMGATGVLSRLAGECFGSSCTFGSVGQASAPGQIPVSQLKNILQLLHGQ